jgi:hypothetical protein
MQLVDSYRLVVVWNLERGRGWPPVHAGDAARLTAVTTQNDPAKAQVGVVEARV